MTDVRRDLLLGLWLCAAVGILLDLINQAIEASRIRANERAVLVDLRDLIGGAPDVRNVWTDFRAVRIRFLRCALVHPNLKSC